jgi:uncharacterized protein (DUF305 family)
MWASSSGSRAGCRRRPGRSRPPRKWITIRGEETDEDAFTTRGGRTAVRGRVQQRLCERLVFRFARDAARPRAAAVQRRRHRIHGGDDSTPRSSGDHGRLGAVARQDVAILCERIVVGQRDEIAMMRAWLGDRGQDVPDAASTRHKMTMNGTTHEMLMPGMLTDEEMAALDRARGPEFDRLFLVGMIKHHQGAIDMVDKLFKSYGAAQDETVFKFASDVYADQSIEIDRMHEMLGSRQ